MSPPAILPLSFLTCRTLHLFMRCLACAVDTHWGNGWSAVHCGEGEVGYMCSLPPYTNTLQLILTCDSIWGS